MAQLPSAGGLQRDHMASGAERAELRGLLDVAGDDPWFMDGEAGAQQR